MNTRRLTAVITGPLLITIAACSDGIQQTVAPASPSARASLQAPTDDSIPNSYVILFRGDSAPTGAATERLIDALHKKFGGHIKFRYDAVHGFAVDSMPASVARLIAKHPAVAYVEPDRILRAADTQANPGAGLDRTNQDYLPLDNLFDYGSNIGGGANVYVIDTGVDSLNPEFTGRIGNGKSCVSQGGPYSSSDSYGHGTAVASVAAGTTFGVAKHATIHSVRISGDAGGTSTTSIMTCGINWIGTYGLKPGVANMSFGGVPSDFVVATAISNVINFGLSFVKAAGNDGIDAYQDRGNRAQYEIVVGATDPTNDSFAYFSDYGSTITILAPGVNVLVADKFNPGYGKIGSGTSFAAPYVAGVAAAMLASYPWTPAEVHYEIPLHQSVSNVVSGLPTGTPNTLLVKHGL